MKSFEKLQLGADWDTFFVDGLPLFQEVLTTYVNKTTDQIRLVMIT